MTTETKENIARNSASIWCRCFKCDGIIRNTNDKCDKEKLLTCHQWYHGYRTALIALGDYEHQMMNSLWHDASEKPVASKTKIVQYTDGNLDMFRAYEAKDDYDNYYSAVNQCLEEKGILVKQWAYLEDLFPAILQDGK